jgi:hypothetical protein
MKKAVAQLFGRVFPAVLGTLAMLSLSGCSSTAMKGTPFYTGEYAKRNGPAEQCLNAWPVVYYRDPALSVLWPVIEKTDEHFALRPVFSVYGLDSTNREYNFFWPLAQFDRASHDNRVFPFFWNGQSNHNYLVCFPAYWHFGHPLKSGGGSDSFFPLWLLDRNGTNDFSFYSPLWMQGADGAGEQWKLLTGVFYQSSGPDSSAFVTALWSQGRTSESDWKLALPLCYWDAKRKTMLSPLWATWREGDARHWFSLPVLTWMVAEPGKKNLWAAGALARASWGTNAGPHYVLPFYYRDRHEKELLTPLFGWKADTNSGFFYPFTPLAGVYTGKWQGEWLFPLFSHSRNMTNTDRNDRWLLVAGREKRARENSLWTFPVFSYENHGPLEIPFTNAPGAKNVRYAGGTEFICLPGFWWKNRSRRSFARPFELDSTSGIALPNAGSQPSIEREFKHGLFPIWSYSRRTSPTDSYRETNASIGLFLWDYKRQTGSRNPSDFQPPKDYARSRVLWRLWHCEKTNGDVAIDIFPAITCDRKASGYRKTSFLGHFFRYEKTEDHRVNADLLFIPILRTKGN